jgi:Protein of unknown function (DUF664)
MPEPAARVNPTYTADEMTMLRSYLDYHRETFRWKTSRLSQQQLSSPYPPSTLTASDVNIAGAAEGVDTVAVRRHPRTGAGISLRWILLHMIEEYARHNGHADLIRERVDGLVGE